MAIAVTFAGNNYSVPETAEVGWSSLTDYLVALSNASSPTALLQNIRIVTSATATLASTDFNVLVNFAGAATITLPSGLTKQIYAIYDTSGAAYTNNITVNTTGGQTIDGASSYIIKSNRGGVLVQFDGTSWKILAEYFAGQLTHKNNATNASYLDAAIIGRSTFATAADGQETSATFEGSNAIEFLIALDSGEAIECRTSYKSSTISAISDPDTIFVNASSGTSQIAVSKSANSASISVRNNMGSSKVVEIRSLTNRIVSPTAWA